MATDWSTQGHIRIHNTPCGTGDCSASTRTRTLNALGVPPPSMHDRTLNPHRSGTAWTQRTVAAILANPRYTVGEYGTNRASIISSRPPGHKPSRRWNPRDQWVISNTVAHPPLVSEADFAQAQQIIAVSVADDGTADRYQLTGLVICGLCGRRAEGHWAYGRARYRCRHGYTSSSDAQPCLPKTLYVRQDQLVEQASIRFANLTATGPAALTAIQLAAQLHAREITIVCTPVSVTLDTGQDTATVIDTGTVIDTAARDVNPETARPDTDADHETPNIAQPRPASAIPQQQSPTKTPTKTIHRT